MARPEVSPGEERLSLAATVNSGPRVRGPKLTVHAGLGGGLTLLLGCLALGDTGLKLIQSLLEGLQGRQGLQEAKGPLQGRKQQPGVL